MNHCGGCGKPIEWAITAANGRSIPLDPDPSSTGNLLGVERTAAGVLVVAVVAVGDPAARVPHFATCTKKVPKKGRRR